MSLFSQIKSFVGTVIKNPIKSVAIAYLIYRLLKKHTQEESLEESLRVLKKGNKHDLIFDTVTKSYLVIAHDGSFSKGYSDESSARKAFPESVKMNKLYEKVINNAVR